MSSAKRQPVTEAVEWPSVDNGNRHADRLISKLQVLDRVGVSYPTLWQWMRQGKFPRSRELGGKSCWIEREINEWIAGRPLRRLKGDAP
jgi:predicted DNA-binding transcriptional regulator AlpA